MYSFNVLYVQFIPQIRKKKVKKNKNIIFLIYHIIIFGNL